MKCIVEQFLDLASGAASVTFYKDTQNQRIVPYRELVCGAMKVAGHLQSLKIERGARVALVLESSPEFYHTFFGAALAGLVPVAVNPPQAFAGLDAWVERTSAIFKKAQCKIVFSQARFFTALGRPVLSAKVSHGVVLVENLQTEEAKIGELIIPKSSDLAFLQFSSGTTGTPKAVAISYGNLAENVEAILHGLALPRQELRAVSWLPLYHDMGLVGMLMGSIVAKSNLCLIKPEHFVTKPLCWLQAISDFKGSISVAPNFAFGLCTKRIRKADIDSIDLSSWKIALCGAETVHTATLNAFAERFESKGFCKTIITPVYGLAEATLAVSFSAAGKGAKFLCVDKETLLERNIATPSKEGLHIACLGRPLRGVHVEVRSDDGRTLPENHLGELWVKSASVMRGYFESKALSESVLVDGWLATGDLAFLHNGEIYLSGRSKDTVIIRGRNLDPAHIEQALHSITGLRTGRAVAFSVPSLVKDTEELVIAAEVRATRILDSEDQLLKDAIKSHLLKALGLQVNHIALLPPGSLPRTPSGKLQRFETRKRWLRGVLVGQTKREIYTKVGSELLLGQGAHLLHQLRGGFARFRQNINIF